MKDDSLSQGAKTLLPMSLGLVAKREKGLQMEATKLEQVFHQRNEMLGALRESHEYLLTANGQLQERNRLQREKLGLLRTRLETDQAQREEIQQGLYKAQGTNELEATAEKCRLLNSVLIALMDKRTGLEQRCMALEEQTSREKRALYTKAEQLSEAQCTLLLVREDIRSIQWNYASTQNELTDKDQYLRSVSQHAQQQATILINVEAAVKASKTEVEDFEKIWQNCEHMAHEELRQLAIENEYATSKQRDLEKLLGSDGATCLADQEVLQAATELQLHLQQLNENATSVKYYKRELTLRRKQEKDLMAIIQSNIKAKEERLSWLERHRFHLKNEQCEASKAYAADESAFRAFCEEHSKAMRSLDQEIKDGRKTLKVTERAISARNKKVAAVRKRVAQRNKVCHEWQAKIKAMQDEMAKVVAFKERIDVEVQSGQFMLEEEHRRGDQIQQQSAAHEREVIELRSTCAALESEIQDTQNNLCKPMQSKLAMAEIAVTNHVNEIRDNFLSSFAVDAADGLIEQISKEIDGWVRNFTDEVNKAVARQTLELNEKYKCLVADTRKDYDKIMKQKGALYDALVKKLKKKTEKRATSTPPLTSKKNEMAPLRLAMDHTYELKEARMSEDSKSENNPEVHKPNLTQTVSNQGKSAVRRQLAPRMNLMDESFQSHKEIPEIAPTRHETSPKEVRPARISLPQHTKGAREPRLKRRKRAQKSGKAIAAHVTPEGTLSIIDNYENTACTSASKVSSKDPLESPVGCDDEPTVTKEATRNRSIQRASKVSIHQEEYPTNKGSGKRSKSTTTFRRNKPSRVSLGRSLPAIHAVDWSAADTFSFD